MIKKLLMPYIAQVASSNCVRKLWQNSFALKRRLLGKPATLYVFIHINDGYSYLLLQELVKTVKYLKVDICIKPIDTLSEEAFPCLQLWQDNAAIDCIRLAKLYGLTPPKIKGYSSVEALKKNVQLLKAGNNLSQLIDIFAKESNADYIVSATDKLELENNRKLLDKLGHYAAGMVYFDGGWYWGIDRFHYLISYLEKAGLITNEGCHFFKEKTLLNNNDRGPYRIHSAQLELEFFWSARSPYSYLALTRTIKLAHKYNIPLKIRPVLPMLMRGLPVPEKKKRYIFFDTKREANSYQIPYGKVADPIGLGVEYCYALLYYATKENKLTEFIENFAYAVNSEGIHAQHFSGMKKIINRSGLDWQIAKQILKKVIPNQTIYENELVKKNQEALDNLNLWGVPSYHLKNQAGEDFVAWGQDRLMLLEDFIQKQLGRVDL